MVCSSGSVSAVGPVLPPSGPGGGAGDLVGAGSQAGTHSWNVLNTCRIKHPYPQSSTSNENLQLMLYEPRCEKTSLWGFRPGPTQTGLYSHRR